MLAICNDQQVVQNIPIHSYVGILIMDKTKYYFIYNKFQLTLFHQILHLRMRRQYQVDKQDMPYAKQHDMLLV
jgi:hypothetical protein